MSNTRLYFYTIRAKLEHNGPIQRVHFFSTVSDKSIFNSLEKNHVINSSESGKEIIIAQNLYHTLSMRNNFQNANTLLRIMKKYAKNHASMDDRFFTTKPLIKCTQLEKKDAAFVMKFYEPALQMAPNPKASGCTIL